MEKALSIVVISFLLSGAIQTVASADPLCEGVPEGEVAVFPYEADCSKYWECFGSEKELKSCPDGLWFNAELQSCDWPEDSGCVNPTTTTSPTGITVDPRCSSNETAYLPHPVDCSKYIECFQGDSYEMQCPGDFWFDAIEEKCVEPEDANCQTPTTERPTTTEKPTTTTSPTTTKTTTTTTEPTTTTTSTTLRPTTSSPSNPCANIPDGATILKPYEGDCNKYWQCIGSKGILMSCPDHLYFNEDRQLCDWPSASGCDDTTRTPDPSTTNTPLPPTTPDSNDDDRCVDGEITYWPIAEDCTKYIECYEYKAYIMSCPGGLYFNDDDDKCEDPAQSECVQPHVMKSNWFSTYRPSRWFKLFHW